MAEFEIEEISGVDRPAQKGAKRVMILKRASDVAKIHPKDGESKEDFVARFMSSEAMQSEYPDEEQRLAVAYSNFGEKVKKDFASPLLLSDEDGHSHMIDAASSGGFTTSDAAMGEEYGHYHPWVRLEDGSIRIGAARGHAHEIVRKDAGSAGKEIIKENEMSQNGQAAAPAPNDELAKANEALRVAKAYGELNDAEKAYHAKQDDAGKAAFLGKSAADRAAIVAQANAPAPSPTDANPVVYKTDSGIEIRKSDGAAVAQIAQENDRNARALKAERAINETSRLEKRANDLIPNMPGTVETKVAVLKSLERIEDAATRGAVEQFLKAANDAIASRTRPTGSRTPAPTSSGVVTKRAEAEEKLDVLAKEIAKRDAVSYEAGYAKAVKTDEGRELYAVVVDEDAE